MFRLAPRLSIRGKVLASGVVVVVLIALFISVYYPWRQERATVAAMRDRARGVAGMLALGVGVGLELNEFEAVTAAFEWARQDPSLAYVVVVDSAGRSFASFDRNHAAPPPGVAPRADSTVLREDRDHLHVATPVRFRGTRHGTLMLGLSLAPMRAQIARERLVALLVSLAVLAVGVGLSVFFANRIAQPIDLLRQAADAIAAGRHDVILPSGQGDELAALTAAFSVMVVRIRESLAELADQRQFLRQIIDANPDLIFVKDADGVYTLANRAVADFYGTAVDDLVGKRDGDFGFAPEAVARFVQEDRDVLVSRQPTVIPEKPLTNPRTGQTHWFRTVKVPLVSSDGGTRQVLGVATDVTQRKQLEEQYRQAQKMEAVGQLTGGIAHDLNNVLTAIRANADLIAQGLPDGLDEINTEVTEVQAAAARGAAMIRKLLAFSRRDMLALQPLHLSRLVTDLAPTLGRLIPTSIDIQVFAGGELPAIEADTGAVEQVLLNLATNARDAMPQGGVLRIETRRAWLDEESRAAKGWGDPGEYVCCTVSDTGVGMDAATQAHVFEPFFTTKPVGAGTGLGMAMVYGLMKQHRGFVDLYSELGLGTTVKLYFPVTTEAVAERVAVVPASAPPRGTETILVAEDEAPIRRAAERVLGRLGYQVFVAKDGEEALAVFAAHEAEIDLVVTDMVMPKLGGRALHERLRSEGKQVPFLFSSGYTARDVQESSALDPTLPFLHKPWTLTDLAHRVREVLDGA